MLKMMWIDGLFGFMPLFDADGGGAGGGSGATGGDTGDDGDSGDGKDGKDGKGAEDGSGDDGDDKDKKFTQADINKLLKKEKNSAQRALLKKLLNTEDIKTAEEGLAKYNAWLESQKTEAQKAEDKLKDAESKKAEAERERDLANNKIKAIQAGVLPKKVDDFIILATAKVNDDNDFDAVVEQMKKDYPNMFGEGSDGGDERGTGGANNPQRKKQTGAGTFGKRLAESSKSASATKDSYFSN